MAGGKQYFYAWRLAQNKFYIGRVLEGPWIKLYPMEELVETRGWTCFLDEENLTRIYADRHGHENVRGGPWSCVELPLPSAYPLLLNRFRRGECGRCGFDNHPIYRCYARRGRENGRIVNFPDTPFHRRLACRRCGKRTHTAYYCPLEPVL